MPGYAKPVTTDVKTARTQHACPHCGKMMSFAGVDHAAPSGLGPTKNHTEKKVYHKAAEDQALVGKVKKGLHEAFPKDTNASDQAPGSAAEEAAESPAMEAAERKAGEY
jgi:hypothetical protein